MPQEAVMCRMKQVLAVVGMPKGQSFLEQARKGADVGDFPLLVFSPVANRV